MKKIVIAGLLSCMLSYPALAQVSEEAMQTLKQNFQQLVAPMPIHFMNPKYKTFRVDACYTWNDCGQSAADAFCEYKGHKKALNWKIEKNIGNVSTTYLLGAKKACNVVMCDGFKMITCEQFSR